MPSRQIVINFEFPQNEQQVAEQSLVARVRALGEDLFREFSRNGEAILNIHDVDKAIDQLSIELPDKHHTGSVIRFINKQLARHNFANIAHISKLERGASSGQDKSK